jgi:hypothetical protein
MGSFDEAIRQHLDLKRRRGADPREVAHLEREALGPSESTQIASLPEALRATQRPYDVQTSIGEPPRQAHLSTVHQATEEIDMGAVFAQSEPGSSPEARPAQAYDWSADLRSPDIGDPLSSFEWEMPSRRQLPKAA